MNLADINYIRDYLGWPARTITFSTFTDYWNRPQNVGAGGLLIQDVTELFLIRTGKLALP